MNAFPDFIGEALTVSVTGEGVAIDPATGLVTIRTDALTTGVAVAVTARGEGGVATSIFRATMAPNEAGTIPLVMTRAPALLGAGVIGAPVTLDPGVWSVPLETLAPQWRRDGTAITGANGTVYAPVAADDRTALSCAVTASNAAGALIAVTDPLDVTFPAPFAAGGLADLLLRLGSGVATINAAAKFVGADLVFTVAGAGASIDAASGVVSLSTNALRAEETVTVSAANSGGVATSSFKFTVADAAPVSSGVALQNLSYIQNTGVKTFDASVGFTGVNLIYAIATPVAGISINAGAGVVSTSTTALLASTPLTVRATNTGGSVQRSFSIGVAAAAGAAPTLSGARIADQLNLIRGAAATTVSAAPAFSGTVTAYSITGAGVSINAATGLITIAKTSTQAAQTVTVRATNGAFGFAETTFRMSVITAPTVTTVATVAQLQAAMLNAAPGEIIEVTPGSKTGTITSTAAVTKSPSITIRPQDRANPPIFREKLLELSNWNGLILDGLHFDNDAVEERDVWQPFALRFTECANIKVTNCHFRDWFGAIDCTCANNSTGSSTNFEISWNTVIASRCDLLRMYQRMVNLRIHHNKLISQVNLAWQKDTNRHPDAIQFACTSARRGCDTVIVEDNYIETLQAGNDLHGVFMFNEKVCRDPFADLNVFGHMNMTVRRNYIRGTNCQGIAPGGVKGALIEQNLLLRAAGSATTDFYTPQIYLISAFNDDITISNNAWPLIGGQSALKYGVGSGTNITKSGNISSDGGAVPVGWASTDVARGIYGQYGNG